MPDAPGTATIAKTWRNPPKCVLATYYTHTVQIGANCRRSDPHYDAPFDFSNSPLVATSVVFSVGPDNDSAMGIGEVQFFGGAVPEPASWAMMVGGFGLAGLAMRRWQRTAPRFG